MPDHLHERHRRRAQGRRARPALPRRPAPAGRALARRAARRARLVHGRQRLEQVGAQRLHRPVAARRGGAAARRALRRRAAPGDPGGGARRGAVHGADRVPGHRQARRSRDRPPALRGLVAAGEALNPEVLRAWHEATGLWIRDGYGQTETGQITGMPLGRDAVPGLDGPRAAGDRRMGRRRRARRRPGHGARPSSAATWATAAPSGPWRTGDRVTRDEDGFLFFEGRNDDVIISAGYRIGPFEVESALVEHPAVAEAAVVAAPDDERGAVVRAVVVLRDGPRPVATSSPASCRTTSRRRPRLTSTRASSSSPRSCPRRRAARSGAPRCEAGSWSATAPAIRGANCINRGKGSAVAEGRAARCGAGAFRHSSRVFRNTSQTAARGCALRHALQAHPLGDARAQARGTCADASPSMMQLNAANAC